MPTYRVATSKFVPTSRPHWYDNVTFLVEAENKNEGWQKAQSMVGDATNHEINGATGKPHHTIMIGEIDPATGKYIFPLDE